MPEIPVEWVCPECYEDNKSDWNSSPLPTCTLCGIEFEWEDVVDEETRNCANAEVERLANEPDDDLYWQVSATVNIIAIVKANSRDAAIEIVQNYEYNDDVTVEDQRIHFLDVEVTLADPHTHQPDFIDEDYDNGE